MRLISMSTHSSLKLKERHLREYAHLIDKVFCKVRHHNPKWRNPIVEPTQTDNQQELIILIGSQKGLCGSFNTHLFSFFEHHVKDDLHKQFIAIGQKSIDYLKNKQTVRHLIHEYEKFSPLRISTIAQEIVHTIMQTKPHYKSVSLYANTFKSFFYQKPKKISLIPLKQNDVSLQEEEEIIFEPSPEKILSNLITQYLETQIEATLFDSQLAEHSARFISMDSATRNANNLLEVSRLDYNKLRQAKITQELTELASSFQGN